MRTLCLTIIFSVLAASGSYAHETRETVLVRKIFADLQPLSISEGVEYCGYIGLNDKGTLQASVPTRGDEGTCTPNAPKMIDVILASYHTHGSFSVEFYNEIPSGMDMETDEEEGIDGYVATPGGRLWYVDTSNMIVSQICGLGCLPGDKDFRKYSDGVIKESYTYKELIIKLGE